MPTRSDVLENSTWSARSESPSSSRARPGAAQWATRGRAATTIVALCTVGRSSATCAWWSGDPIEPLVNTPESCQTCYRIATKPIDQIDALFDQIPPPETEEEVNEALIEAGYNPDEVAEEFRSLAKSLLGKQD